MNIAVTGATGFIGKYVVQHFTEQGHAVKALGRSKTKLDAVFQDHVDKEQTDYSYGSLVHLFQGANVVIHLAAKRLSRDTNPLKLDPFLQPNILTTENVCLAALECNVSTVCHTSSISVYSGIDQLPYSENTFPTAANIYGVSKLCSEHLANYLCSGKKTRVYNLRIDRIFGHGEREDLVIMKYINLANNSRMLSIWGEGKTSIDYVYVKDVVDVIDKVIQSKAPSGAYNIGSGKLYSVKEIAEVINEVFQNEGNIQYDHSKKEGGYKIFMDVSKVKKLLNWRAKWTLKDAVQDIKSHM